MNNLGLLVSGIISKVPGMTPGLTIDITVNKVNTKIDPSTNKPYPSSAAQDRFKANILELTEDEKESSVLRLTELKLLVYTDGVLIDSASKVGLTRQGSALESFNIIQCQPTYVGALAVVNTLFLKK